MKVAETDTSYPLSDIISDVKRFKRHEFYVRIWRLVEDF